MKIIKEIKYIFFNLIYKKPKIIINVKKNIHIKVKKIFFSNLDKYNLYKIKKGRVYSNTVSDTAYILDNKLIREPSFQFRTKKNLKVVNGRVSENIVLTRGTPNFKRKINGSVLSLLTGGAGKNNYWHWMFDVLPRIAIFEKAALNNFPDFYLLPSSKQIYQKQSIVDLDIQHKKILDGEKIKHFECNILFVVDHPNVKKNNPSQAVENIPIWILKWLRKKYLSKVKIKKNYPKKIFISRENDSNLDLRRIVNSSEVESFLENMGFHIITLANHSFNEQISLFNNAKTIIGLHGAGFANMIFSKKKTNIIEIRSKDNGKAIKNLARKCGHNYKEILEKNINLNLKHQNSHIKVNLNKLKKIIRSY